LVLKLNSSPARTLQWRGTGGNEAILDKVSQALIFSALSSAAGDERSDEIQPACFRALRSLLVHAREEAMDSQFADKRHALNGARIREPLPIK
jgi:hypothetical protein